MARVVAEHLETCTDCTQLIANGEVTDSNGVDISDDLMTRIVEHLGEAHAAGLVNNCSEECDGWFSHSDCETCGSPLGGDRHYAAIILPE